MRENIRDVIKLYSVVLGLLIPYTLWLAGIFHTAWFPVFWLHLTIVAVIYAGVAVLYAILDPT